MGDRLQLPEPASTRHRPSRRPLLARGEALRERAAEPSFLRLASDLDAARHRHVHQLLDFIARHLFDPELRVGRMKGACGIRDNSSVLRFRAEVGLPPSAYVRDLRMETGARLLVETALRAGDVGALIGYPEHATFSRAFAVWSGLAPHRYRGEMRPHTEDQEEERWVARLVRLLEEIPEERVAAVLARACGSAVTSAATASVRSARTTHGTDG